MVNPLPKIYCHGTWLGLSINRTTKGPKDHKIPAIKTTGAAILGFLNSSIIKG